jgi:hypothetical protein
LGEQKAEPRPVVGGVLLTAGYIISGILGCEIRYFNDAPVEIIPTNKAIRSINSKESKR